MSAQQTRNRSVWRYQSTHLTWAPSLLKQLHACSGSAACQMPIALFQHCSTSLLIAQLPKLPYTTQRGGEICQTGTGPPLNSNATVFDSQLGNCKIKGLGKWNAGKLGCESKQTMSWEVVEEEWTRRALRRITKIKWKVSKGQKTKQRKNYSIIVKLLKCIIGHLIAAFWVLTKNIGSSLCLETSMVFENFDFLWQPFSLKLMCFSPAFWACYW